MGFISALCCSEEEKNLEDTRNLNNQQKRYQQQQEKQKQKQQQRNSITTNKSKKTNITKTNSTGNNNNSAILSNTLTNKTISTHKSTSDKITRSTNNNNNNSNSNSNTNPVTKTTSNNKKNIDEQNSSSTSSIKTSNSKFTDISETEKNIIEKSQELEEEQEESSTEKEKTSTKMTAYYNSESSQGNEHSSYTDTFDDANSNKNLNDNHETINSNANDQDIEMTDENKNLNLNDVTTTPIENDIITSPPQIENNSNEMPLYNQEEQINISPSDKSTEQQLYSNANDVQNDMDYNMISNYEDSEEYVDLTELQPDQYHATGYNTLLPPITKQFKHKKCLVLDLDETLVHSSFKYLRSADFVLPVDIDDQIHNVYVIKRPGVDEFLKRVGELYEVVVFTASVSRYGDPLLNKLDINKAIHHRLFREACYNYEGNYIKNLSQIGRPLSDIIILDNSPASYIFHPQHAIPISSWFSDTHDNELLDIIPLLEDLSKRNVLDVGKVLDVSI